MIVEPNHKKCECFSCEERKKEYPDCACESGPYYCPMQCNPCPGKNNCDVPENKVDYIWETLCKSCDTKVNCIAYMLFLEKNYNKQIYILHIKNEQQRLYSNYVQSGFIGTIFQQDEKHLYLKCFIATTKGVIYGTINRVRKCDIANFKELDSLPHCHLA